MPVISRFFGIIIAIYWNDHSPPHFHAKYAGSEVVIDIQTGLVLNGSFPKRALVLVEEWRHLRLAELIRDWELARERKPLQDIAPLE